MTDIFFLVAKEFIGNLHASKAPQNHAGTGSLARPDCEF